MTIINIYDFLCFFMLITINILIVIGYHGIKDNWIEKKSFAGSITKFFWGNKNPKLYLLYIIVLLTLSIEKVFGRSWDAMLVIKLVLAILTLLLVFLSPFFIDIPDAKQMEQIKKFR